MALTYSERNGLIKTMLTLTCPECRAQFEIPEELIPPNGRKVQCSACKNIWFQEKVRQDDNAELQRVDIQEDPPRKKIDPSVIKILQTEAKREQNNRQAQRINHERDIRKSIPRQTAASSEENLMPDMDVIAKSLDANARLNKKRKNLKFSNQEIGLRHNRRRSFSVGFLAAGIILGFGWVVYAFSEQIEIMFPEYETQLSSYIEMVNMSRVSVEDFANRMLELAGFT